MNGSVVSVLISDVGISGTEHSQHPWSPMEFWYGVPVRRTGTVKWCGNLAASMESHGERVWKPGSIHGVQ